MNSEFAMRLQTIALANLRVNQRNDRHGELASERDAIAWLFHEKEDHMRNLAKDISAQGEIYEPPLVRFDARVKSFVVFDGNRRVSCLKLLLDPKQAPTVPLQQFFARQIEEAPNGIPEKIECQIEDDLEKIDEILYRRHTGAQSGVGRSQWDDTAKHNFLNRSGKQIGVNLSESVENALVDDGRLARVGDLPRSNLKRLLSAEEFRNRVGLSVSKRKLYLTHARAPTLKALTRIAQDLIDQRLVLGDLWNNGQKRTYLDDLEREGVLPKEGDRLSTPTEFGIASRGSAHRARRPTTHPTSLPERRLHLIRGTAVRIDWTSNTDRHRDIWNELQDRLFLDRHANAIAVLARVLLEISVDHAATVMTEVGAHPNDDLKNKVAKVSRCLEARGQIDKKYAGEIRKFVDGEAIVSANTMHRYVHSTTFAPSPQHLLAIWDTLQRFIVLCLNSKSQ